MDNNIVSGDPIKTGNTAPRVPLMTRRQFETAKSLGRLSLTCPHLKIWSTCGNGVQTVSAGDLMAIGVICLDRINVKQTPSYSLLPLYNIE